MDMYVLKSSACLAVFFLFYKLFLENENMHFFKRFFLIVTLVLSFLIPLLTFTVNVDVAETISPFVFANVQIEESRSFLFSEILPAILWMIYFIGILFFSIRFGNNLSTLLKKIKRNPKLDVPPYVNVLVKKKVIPHTFLKYIFLNQENFEAGQIPEEVLLHEQTHATQRHSMDILFIEILQILFWFNPLIYLFKNSIKLNHEFLADQGVLSKGIDSITYQEILLMFSSNTTSPILANSINYSLIKKRFTVMKTKTSKNKIWFRSLLILPLLTILIFGFSTIEEVHLNETNSSEIVTQDGANKAQINEYNKLARHYNKMDQSTMKIKKYDVERLKYLYNLMASSQQKEVEPFPNFPPPPPTADKIAEPMIVKVGVNDKHPDAPPAPPKAPKAPKSNKVIKGVNDTNANVPPPPAKQPEELKAPLPAKNDIKIE